jgi:hypothetical protein
MSLTKSEIEKANKASVYKIRIFAQAVLYQRRKIPITRMERHEIGIEVPVTVEYDELECPQFAVNYNGIYMREGDLDELLKALNTQVKKSMKDKGLII